MGSAANRIWRWFASTSNRTFVVWPIVVTAVEAALNRGWFAVEPWAAVLLVWGYLQYRLVGRYRLREGGGGPGLSVPPERLVTHGPYRYVRNPMYLGHLIFFAGVALTLRSWVGAVLFTVHVFWFHRRALQDETRLRELFGAAYADYAARVKRWMPGIV